ncbi:MAG: universal stress protein [Bacteroidales bacterium]|nr:universal stress protein [Bacteroidales bacterium]
MKKIIIVGMDFSEGSLNALNFAVQIANVTDSNIMLVWVDKKKNSGTVYSNAFDPRMEAKKRFEELIEEFGPRLKTGRFLYKIRNGKVHKEIVNQAKYHDAFLIIAGTHGTSGFEEFWIGSSAYKIVTYAPCPVITLRYGEDWDAKINKIVFPLDNSRETRQKINLAAYMAEVFDAKILVLSIYSSNVENLRDLVDGYADQIETYLEEREISFERFSIESENLTEATIDFAKEQDADMITIMTEQETSPANLLLGPFAQQMVNHSPIPILSLRSKSIYDHQTK